MPRKSRPETVPKGAAWPSQRKQLNVALGNGMNGQSLPFCPNRGIVDAIFKYLYAVEKVGWPWLGSGSP